jgi:23S rRNA pseudouridine1911/1915/1917 synthase
VKREASKNMKTQNILVPSLDEPERLDKFLIRNFPQTSRAYWKEHLIQTVRVDGKRVAKGHLLRGGEKLNLLQAPLSCGASIRPNFKLHLKILYKDHDLMAIDKAPGLPCHPLTAEETETVANAVVAKFPEQAETGPQLEAGLLHRLDNDTSGVLLFARHPKSLEAFQRLNRGGNIAKYYLAWVEGHLNGMGKIRFPIAHHPQNKAKMCIARDEKDAKRLKAREATTEFGVIQSEEQASLVLLRIQKGSRHQIRVHLAALGHPIVGDILYGGKRGGFAGSSTRHLLHAAEVQFIHPFTKKQIAISSPIPKDFVKVAR